MFSIVKGVQLVDLNFPPLKRRLFNRIMIECSVDWRMGMSYRIVFWSAVGWVALCIAPYVYALNDLITWR
jgi:hypothetical protein